MARRRTTLCKLQMLRLAAPGWRLPAAVMGDLSLARYHGFADLPEAAPLKARLAAEVPETLANGIHLIVVQSADGSLVVGDLHHYDDSPDPFAPQAVEGLILRHMAELLDVPQPVVTERWVGIYPCRPGRGLRRGAGRGDPGGPGHQRHRHEHRLRHRRGGGGRAVRRGGPAPRRLTVLGLAGQWAAALRGQTLGATEFRHKLTC